MSQEARWLLSPDPRRKEREAAFHQYDEMVCAVLSELKSAMFPQTYILEDTLKEKIVEAINVAVSGKNSFLAILKKNIETVLSEDLDESTAYIDKRLEELQTELIQKANSKEEYDNIVNEIYRLRDLRQETLSRNALRQDKRDRIT